jgi:hypothetical protein
MNNLSGARAWEYVYVKALKERMQDLKDSLVGGDDRKSCEPETYHYICGQIRGIQVCIDDLTEMRKRFNLDQDEDLLEANL